MKPDGSVPDISFEMNPLPKDVADVLEKAAANSTQGMNETDKQLVERGLNSTVTNHQSGEDHTAYFQALSRLPIQCTKSPWE